VKAVHVTTVHSPTDTRIFHKECCSLVKAGNEVVLLAPNGRDDCRDGVRIVALPIPRGRWDRVMRTLTRAYRSSLTQGGDVYHFHDPELIPAGLLLRLVHRKRVVYDVHEDVPRDIYTKDYIPGPLRWVLARLMQGVEWLAGRLVSGVSAATQPIGARFPAGKTAVVQNFPRTEELVPNQDIDYGKRENVIAYVGGLARIRGTLELVDAMEHVPRRYQARLELAGVFQPEAMQGEASRRPGWKAVSYLGWLDRVGIAEVLGRARIGIVTLHPITTYLDAQPVKLYEYMAAGLPVIASDFPNWREVIDGVGCGLLVDPLDPRQIYDAIEWLFDHPEEAEAMGRRGRGAVLEKYNWRAEEQKLFALYDL